MSLTDGYPIAHAGCPNQIRMGLMGIDINIGETPPCLVDPVYLEAMTCPHGVTYYWEPTPDQVAEWARKGVA